MLSPGSPCRPRRCATTNAPKRVTSSEIADRGFCPECGTQIYWQSKAEPELIDITTNSLDEPDRVPPRDHVFTGSRPAWADIAGHLPQYRARRIDG